MTLQDCFDRAVQALVTAQHTQGEMHARAVRSAAEAVVDARSLMAGPEDSIEPDWLGRTYAYRSWMAEVYGAAGIPPSQRRRFRSILGYHVSNVIHERLSPETIEALGLDHRPLRVRRGDRAARVADAGRLLRSGTILTDRDDMDEVVAAIKHLAMRLPEDHRGAALQLLGAYLRAHH